MCGIAGYFRLHDGGDRTAPDLLRMTGLLLHRGPDDDGFYEDSSSGLGMRRLSIIDLETGRQPIASEDGTVIVVFNGEIYNYRELRSLLAGKGHVFRTRSDTEILVHGYEEWGEELPLRLRGMFAFAVRDTGKDSLLVCRDHFGVKPLYYAESGGFFLFGSEIKSLLSVDGLSRDVDALSVHQYLSLLYIPEPRTIYESVEAIPPGCLMTVTREKCSVRRYWRPVCKPRLRSPEEAAEEIRAVMQDSVRAMMVSDVPLGVFLSGGLDSTCILAMMARESGAPVKTFTIGFGKKEKSWDELELARITANTFGADHHEFLVDRDVLSYLPHVVKGFDQPFANPTSVILYLLSAETGRHVKVALSGTGGDEMFGGYPRYRGMMLYQHYRRVPGLVRRGLAAAVSAVARDSSDASPKMQRARRFFSGGAHPFDECYIRLLTVMDRERKSGLYTDEFRARIPHDDEFSFLRASLSNGETPEIERVAETDIAAYLPFNQLAYCDRMSMARSLEVRVPFVDRKVAEVALSIPMEMKLLGGETKGLFRKAMAKSLPREILGAPKLGLNLPISLWFRNELKDWVMSVLSEKRIRSRGIFRPGAVRLIIEEHMSGRRDFSLFLWALIMLDLWMQIYIDGKGAPEGRAFPDTPALF